MKMKYSSFVMTNFVKFQAVVKKEDWAQGIFRMEQITFEDGTYAVGPMVFSLDVNHFQEPELAMTYYLPVSWEVDTSKSADLSFERQLALPNTICIRQADDLANFQEAINQVQQFAQQQNIMMNSQVFFVLTDLYGDYNIDVHFQVLQNKNGGQ